MPPKLVARLKIKKTIKEIWTEIFRNVDADPDFKIIVHPPIVVKESKKKNVSGSKD